MTEIEIGGVGQARRRIWCIRDQSVCDITRVDIIALWERERDRKRELSFLEWHCNACHSQGLASLYTVPAKIDGSPRRSPIRLRVKSRKRQTLHPGQ